MIIIPLIVLRIVEGLIGLSSPVLRILIKTTVASIYIVVINDVCCIIHTSNFILRDSGGNLGCRPETDIVSSHLEIEDQHPSHTVSEGQSCHHLSSQLLLRLRRASDVFYSVC